MIKRLLGMAFLLSSVAIFSDCKADVVVTARVELIGGNVRTASAPPTGDYRFLFGHNQALVTSPNGKVFLFDFARQHFTSLNTASRSYYESDFASVLGIGDHVSSGQMGEKVRGRVVFEPSHLDLGRPELGLSAKSFRVLLESTIISSDSAPGGFAGAFSTRGGITFGGANAAEHSSVVGRRILEGQLWMAEPVKEIDPDQMNTVMECVLLWGSPQLKELSHRIHDSNLILSGGEFLVRTEGQRNAVGVTPPTISIKLKSISEGALDPSSLLVPQGYRRVSPPTGTILG